MMEYWCSANIPPRPLVDLRKRNEKEKEKKKDQSEERIFFFFFFFLCTDSVQFGLGRFGSVRFGADQTGSVRTLDRFGAVRIESSLWFFFFRKRGKAETVR